jgi:hypothetical protein
VVAVTGSNGSRSLQMGAFRRRTEKSSLISHILSLTSGHVWYAVDQDDMTEKVTVAHSFSISPGDGLRSILFCFCWHLRFPACRSQHYHAWRLWKISLPVDAEGWLEFCVRTWDSSNNTEPTFVRSAWKYVHLPASMNECKHPHKHCLCLTAGISTSRLRAIESSCTVSTRRGR